MYYVFKWMSRFHSYIVVAAFLFFSISLIHFLSDQKALEQPIAWAEQSMEKTKEKINQVITSSNEKGIYYTAQKQKPEQHLIALMNNSKKTLDVAAFSITHPDIVKAMIDAKKRGVNVRLITDQQQSGGKSQKIALKLLTKAGIPIRIPDDSGLMHLKLTIADGEWISTGSFNYSKAATTVNDELLIIDNDADIIQVSEEAFEALWKRAEKRTFP